MHEFFIREVAAPKQLPVSYGTRDLAAVVRLQEWLVVRGYKVWKNDANAPGIDGDYGDGTQAGVVAFAKDNSIAPTVDATFWAALVDPMVRAVNYVPKASSNLGLAVAEVAQFYLAQKPREARYLFPNRRLVGHDNSGPWTRAFLAPFFSYPQPWCMGFCRPPLLQAVSATRSPLPFRIDGPGVAPLYVPSIVAQARKANRFVQGSERHAVGPGSLMFVRGVVGGMPSHVHVGIVIEDRGEVVTTIEGNTNNDGSSNGWLVLQMTRKRAGIDFGVI